MSNPTTLDILARQLLAMREMIDAALLTVEKELKEKPAVVGDSPELPPVNDEPGTRKTFGRKEIESESTALQ